MVDPNLFHLDYERLIEVIVVICILSIFVERALSILFEMKFFIQLTEDTETIKKIKKERGEELKQNRKERKGLKGLKEIISFGVSFLAVWLVSFDALTITFASNDTVTITGMLITAAIVAGGSKGSLALFRDVMKVMSGEEKARQQVKKLQQTKS